MRFRVIIAALAIIFCFSMTAYAETQSVTISGDITVRGIHRKEYDLNSNTRPENEDFIMTTTELQFDAELTDNVSTVIRLVNQRNWGDSDRKELEYQYSPYSVQDRIVWENRLVELGVDLAYIQLKEMIFKPVTLRIGRQDLWFGRGLIIGANQVDPGFIFARIANNNLLGDNNGIGAPELTAFNSFDAVRMTLDFEQYAPFVVDLVYFKNDEGLIAGGDDVDVYGVNMGYTWDIYSAEAEAYYWLRDDNAISADAFTSNNEIHTIGTRGSFKPNDDFVFGAEAALQLGKYLEAIDQRNKRHRHAYMMNAFVEYLGWKDLMYSPKVGAEWIFTSGEDDVNRRGGSFHQWNRMYRGYIPMAIRPWQGVYYMTDRFPGGEDSGLTNQHEIMLTGSMQPLDDITFEAKFARYLFAEKPVRRAEPLTRGGNDIGSEINFLTTYDYTEDVTFSLLSAWFFPGEVYDNQRPMRYPAGNSDLQPDTASEVVGTCKVSF